jgi:archaellum biogenesis protein FlaJ (TadC family)
MDSYAVVISVTILSSLSRLFKFQTVPKLRTTHIITLHVIIPITLCEELELLGS